MSPEQSSSPPPQADEDHHAMMNGPRINQAFGLEPSARPVRNWKELATIPANESYSLRIEAAGYGWIVANPGVDASSYYMTSHTFYDEANRARVTQQLQKRGFNVVLAAESKTTEVHFERMHELLEAGLRDLEEIRGRAGWEIYMGVWFARQKSQPHTCRVCLAGALLTQSLFRNEELRSVCEERLAEGLVFEPVHFEVKADTGGCDVATQKRLRDAARYMITLDQLRRPALQTAARYFYSDYPDLRRWVSIAHEAQVELHLRMHDMARANPNWCTGIPIYMNVVPGSHEDWIAHVKVVLEMLKKYDI